MKFALEEHAKLIAICYAKTMDLEQALLADQNGDWQHIDQIYQTLSIACQKDPLNRGLCFRFLNFLAVLQREEELKDWLEGYLDSYGTVDQTLAEEFLMPLSMLLIELGDTVLSFQILDRIPHEIALESKLYKWFHRDWDRFYEMHTAKDSLPVPWHRMSLQWWLQPETLKENHGDYALVRWYAAKYLEEKDGDLVFWAAEISFGKPSKDNQHLLFFDRLQWEKDGGAALTEMSDFWEIGMYSTGAVGKRIINPLSSPKTDLVIKVFPPAGRYEQNADV